MTTARQIVAHRPDARKTTDPAPGMTTREAHERPKTPAPDRGDADVTLPGDDPDLIAERMRAWRDTYRPAPGEQEWLFEQVVVNSLRVDHCRRLESELRSFEARRALLTWDDDRRHDAEATALTLSRRPALVVRRLRKTTQGCDWLIARWRALGRAFETSGAWTPAQRSLAFDLLGTPADLRDGLTWDSPADLVAREVTGLERLQAEALDDLDAVERGAACLGLEIAPSPALLRLRRYEADCLRRYQRFRDRLIRRRRPEAAEPSPRLSPPAPPPSAVASARPAPEPPAPSVPAPVTLPVPADAPKPRITIQSVPAPRFTNRKMRRAAEKIAAGGR